MRPATNAPPDETILAAVERAERHQTRPDARVPIWAILDHLDIRKRTAAARHVRIRLAALQATDLVLHGKRNGIDAWALTPAGREQLNTRRAAGALTELPESPQHRAWRNARTTATQEIARFRNELTDELEAALALLLHRTHDSDSLYAVADHLNRNIKRLASATYCAYEWPEPDDTTADIDTRTSPTDQGYDDAEQQRRAYRRQGRRNFGLWAAPQ